MKSLSYAPSTTLSPSQLFFFFFFYNYFSQSPLCVRYHLFQFPAEESEVQKGRHLSRVTQLSLNFSCQRLYRFSSLHSLPYSFSTQLQKYSCLLELLMYLITCAVQTVTISPFLPFIKHILNALSIQVGI